MDAIEWLCRLRKQQGRDMNNTHQRWMNYAYAAQGQRIAYERKKVPDTAQESFAERTAKKQLCGIHQNLIGNW